MQELKENLNGYLMDVNGSYGNSISIDDNKSLEIFIRDNVEKYHELRITNGGDNLVFHCVNRVLIFPIPDHGNVMNKWDTNLKRFVTKLS